MGYVRGFFGCVISLFIMAAFFGLLFVFISIVQVGLWVWLTLAMVAVIAAFGIVINYWMVIAGVMLFCMGVVFIYAYFMHRR